MHYETCHYCGYQETTPGRSYQDGGVIVCGGCGRYHGDPEVWLWRSALGDHQAKKNWENWVVNRPYLICPLCRDGKHP